MVMVPEGVVAGIRMPGDITMSFFGYLGDVYAGRARLAFLELVPVLALASPSLAWASATVPTSSTVALNAFMRDGSALQHRNRDRKLAIDVSPPGGSSCPPAARDEPGSGVRWP